MVEIKAGKSSRSITNVLRRAIESGVYRDGDQLPPERELSDNYSASRSTVRRALNDLESIGFVSRKVGSGTYVTYSTDQEAETTLADVVEQISPLQLIDARIGFERQMTRLAAVHATGRDFVRLEKLLEGMENAETNKEQFTQLDSEFHMALARASGNPLILQLYNQINEVRTHRQWQAAREAVLSPEKIRQYNVHHRAMLERLRKRDINGTIAALNAHMDLAYQDLIGTGRPNIASAL